MPAKQLKKFLDSHQVKYATLTHSTAYTAQEIASLAHIQGREFAKTVIARIDGALVMAVLPASYQVDLPLLKAAGAGKKIALASETDFPGDGRDRLSGIVELPDLLNRAWRFARRPRRPAF